MFDFSRPVVEACGEKWPTFRVPGRLVHAVMSAGSGCTSSSGCRSRRWNRLQWNGFPSTTTSRSTRPAATSATSRCSPPSRRWHECLPYYTELYDGDEGLGRGATSWLDDLAVGGLLLAGERRGDRPRRCPRPAACRGPRRRRAPRGRCSGISGSTPCRCRSPARSRPPGISTPSCRAVLGAGSFAFAIASNTARDGDVVEHHRAPPRALAAMGLMAPAARQRRQPPGPPPPPGRSAAACPPSVATARIRELLVRSRLSCGTVGLYVGRRHA